jgi:NTE family protein
VLFQTMLDAQVVDFDKDPEIINRTVRIDDFGISSTDFDLTSTQVDQLYQSGIKCTTDFFAAHP